MPIRGHSQLKIFNFQFSIIIPMQIIRRFTPPTCTLEIWGKNSPLSRWTKQKVIKNLGFQLSFDDPRTPEEEQLTISGDREQLEQIYSLVLNYTEEFLKQSFNPQSLASSVVSNVATTANNFSFNLPELASHDAIASLSLSSRTNLLL